MKNTKFIIQAAVIAAVYATLTIALMPFSYGVMQVRVSEALTILPFFTPAAITGLFIGCKNKPRQSVDRLYSLGCRRGIDRLLRDRLSAAEDSKKI